MKTKLLKQISGCILLITVCLFFTSSITPGYDENGNDINECLNDPCPDGFVCINTPGSYQCLAIE